MAKTSRPRTRKGVRSSRTPREDRNQAAVWVIAFLDLMGYRRELLAIGDKPTTDTDEITRRFSTVVDRRGMLVKPLEAYFDRTRPDVYSQPVGPGGPPLSRFIGDVDVAVTGFSDSIFLESSLGSSATNPLVPLNTIVAASIIALFVNLKAGSPVRGGLDIGFGLRNDSHLYCAATVRAVELEKGAKYPRILVGNSSIRTLAGIGSSQETSESRMARIILSALFRDPDDGLVGIDFMGETSRRFYAQNVARDDVEAIWTFAQRSRDEFSTSGMQKESGYYDRLIKYMAPRLEIWGVKAVA